MADSSIQGPTSAFLVAAPRSGEGKTTVSLALAAALSLQGRDVRCFKCGPDYIDPTFLEAASGHPCRNVDTWLMGEEGVRRVFSRSGRGADCALIEGVMGLFDGRGGTQLAGSSLDCARVLGIPVLLVVGARGMARSIAALVRGFTEEARRLGVRIAGVIATMTGSSRHEAMLGLALEEAGLPPLLGCLARDDALSLPSRQLGLTPAAESDGLADVLEMAGRYACRWDLRRILEATRLQKEERELAHAGLGPAGNGTAVRTAEGACHHLNPSRHGPPRRMAVARDEAFCFYYGENLAVLRQQGWEIVEFSPLHDAHLPQVETVYLGGGYPEVFAKDLARNASMRLDIRNAALRGTRIFAECGGYMYLLSSLETTHGTFPMCGVIEGRAVMGGRMRSLGYREVELTRALPFAPEARIVRGHEFHWSDTTLSRDYPPLYRVRGTRGLEPAGVVAGPSENVLAGYIHLYWAHLPSPAAQGMEELTEDKLAKENS